MALTPDSQWLVSASHDSTLKVWDLKTRKEQFTFTGHTHSATGVSITPNGQWVVSVAGDHTVKVWNIHNGEELMAFSGEGAFTCCAISPDGQTIVAGELSGRLHFLQIKGIDPQSKVD